MSHFVEQVPALPLGMLAERGLFSERTGHIAFQWGRSIAQATWSRARKAVTVRIENATLRVQVVNKLSGKKDQLFFICPKSGVHCKILYLWDGILASRQSLGLRYNSELRRGRIGQDVRPGLLPSFPQDPKAAPEKVATRKEWIKARMGTAAAFKNAKQLAEVMPEEFDANFIAALYPPLITGWSARVPGLSPEILENYPRLEMTVLQSLGLFVAGEMKGIALIWMGENSRLCVHVWADLRSPECPRLYIDSQGRGATSHEKARYRSFRLVPPNSTPPMQWLVMCSFGRRAVRNLFWRANFWTSSEAARLVHASQRRRTSSTLPNFCSPAPLAS